MIHTPNDRKVLVIGWDAADWRVIRPLLEADKLPNLKKFMDDGVHGNISTLNPILSPMLWTSIATGKRPYKHGIHGFSEPTPDGQGVRPITNISRKTKAVWNILNQCGKKSVVVGWWPSHPAEPLNGVMVSNHYQRAGRLLEVDLDAEIGKPRPEQHGWDPKQWPMQPGTVHPKEMSRNLQEFRFHPMELEAEHIAPFVPNFAKIDQVKDKRFVGLAKTISDCVSIHGVSTALMQLEPWDLMCVYYDGIDHFGHGFMKYHPPRQEWISEKDFELYSEVVEGSYRFHDMMLGASLALAGEDTTVILLSDHGFHPDHLRPQHIPAEPAGPAIEHRTYGIFVMKGPGVKKGEVVHGASVLDLCPTVLSLFDLPIGGDMDGKPVITAFEETPDISVIDSWDDIDGETGMHPPDMALDSGESAEAMKQLVELGYIEEPSEDQDEAVQSTVQELRYNLAQSYMDGGLHREAIPLLEEIWTGARFEHRFGLNLLACFSATGQWAEREAAANQLYRNIVDGQQHALTEIDEIRAEAKEYGIKLPEIQTNERGQKVLGDWDKGQNEEEEQEHKEPPKKLTFRIRKTMGLLQPYDSVIAWIKASQAVGVGNAEQAIPFLETVAQYESKVPEPHNQVGMAFLQLDRFEDAQAAFHRALETDSENHVAHLGIASAALGLKDFEAAIDHGLSATELVYFNPRAHFVLASALDESGDQAMARTAYEVAIKQAPGFAEAHDKFADFLEAKIGDSSSAEKHRELAKLSRESEKASVSERESIDASKLQEELNKRRAERSQSQANHEDWSDVDPSEVVTIVSGLPRSGTSMMMQMLDRGGLAPFTDGKREADSDNPKGYYEHEKAIGLARDQSWIPEVRGKCVKLIGQLLPALPLADQKYRVVFMDRDLREISRSQRDMLKRLGRSGGDLSDTRMMSTLNAQLVSVEKWMASKPNIQVLFVDYGDVVGNPIEVAQSVNAFFGGILDVDAMAQAVDPSLHRQKNLEDSP